MNQYIKLLVESVFDDETVDMLQPDEDEGTTELNAGAYKKWDNIINTTITTNITKLNLQINPSDFDEIPDGYYKLNKPTQKGKLTLLTKIIQRLSKVFGVCKPAINLNWIDISELTSLENVFYRVNTSFDISRWDVSNVTNMGGLFANSTVLLYTDISKWDVGNVVYTNLMFSYASVSCDLSNWNFKFLTNLSGMFKGIKQFDTDFSNWKIHNKVSAVGDELFADINMDNYKGDKNLFIKSIENFDVSSFTSLERAFFGSLIPKLNLNKWNFTKCSSVARMFSNFTGELTIENMYIPEDLYVLYMFLNTDPLPDISSWNVEAKNTYEEHIENTMNDVILLKALDGNALSAGLCERLLNIIKENGSSNKFKFTITQEK